MNSLHYQILSIRATWTSEYQFFPTIFLLNKSYFQKLRQKKYVQHLWIYYYTSAVNTSIFHLLLKVITVFIINM